MSWSDRRLSYSSQRSRDQISTREPMPTTISSCWMPANSRRTGGDGHASLGVERDGGGGADEVALEGEGALVDEGVALEAIDHRPPLGIRHGPEAAVVAAREGE